MKTNMILVGGMAMLVAGAADSFAACPKSKLELYWPLNDGDIKDFSGPLGSCQVSTSRGSGCRRNLFVVSQISSDSDDFSYSNYEFSASELWLRGITSMGLFGCFEPPLVELNESMAANGGSMTSRTSWWAENRYFCYRHSADLNIKVSRAGTVSVPAGTFQNCLRVKQTITVTTCDCYRDSCGEPDSSSVEYFLAPGVGKIRFGLYNAEDDFVGWQELTGGRVAGTDVRWYAGATPPTIHGVTASPNPVPVHGTATLTASYEGKAPLTFQWKKNGVNLGSSGRITGATSPVLVISNARESDEGTYSVLISNPLDCAESAGAVLEVAPDTVPPVVTITSPANNASIAKAEKAFRGTATDNARVVRVEYRLNSNAWMIASGTTNWGATVALEPGTNRFRSRAVDASGLISSAAEVKVIRIVGSPIQLLTQGQGTITGATHGELLHINRNYTLTATPAPGNLFVNWTGGTCPGPLAVLSSSLVLPFTMRTGLCVQANFVVNPFLSVRGTYHGLYYETTGARAESSGAFRLSVTKRGAYSGEVLHDLDQEPVSGQFALDGKATNRIVRAGMDATFVWELDLDHARTNYLTGHVTDNAGAWEAQLLGDAAPVYGTNASPYQGKYTVVIPGMRDPGITNQPVGDGYGTLLVDAAGLLTFGGSLADGKTVSQGAQVSTNGIWPLYVPLYGGAGMMLSWVQLTTDPPVASPVRSDAVLWGRPAISNATYYPDGFDAITTLTGSKYTAAKPVLPFTDGIVAFVGGNLASNLVYPVTLTASNTVLCPASLRVSITRSNGLFSGTFTPPDSGNAIAFGGAIVQGQTNGCGFFRNGGQSGQVFLGPVPGP